MKLDRKNDLSRSRWSQRTGQTIDLVCLFALVAVVGTVIYGFALRAIWAHGYYIAVAVSIVGATAMAIGLAQQVIAARDAATWHDMAVWQLRAASVKVTTDKTPHNDPAVDDWIESPDYYEHLIRVFLKSVQNEDGV